MVTTRSWAGMTAARTLSRVVLPVPVAPDTAMAIPAATMASSSLAVAASRAFRSTRSRSWSRRLAKVRIVTTGPSGASGGSTAWNRSPPGRRASTQGRDSSTRSPSGATTRWTRAATAAAEAKRTAARSMAPPRSTQTSAGPLTMTSVTVGSASSGASGPSPVGIPPIEPSAGLPAVVPMPAGPPATPAPVRHRGACPRSRSPGDQGWVVMPRPPRTGPHGGPGSPWPGRRGGRAGR